jgi:integrase
VAVQRACKKAGIPPWSPRQLRHTRATVIHRAFGLEVARTVLGHTEKKIIDDAIRARDS